VKAPGLHVFADIAHRIKPLAMFYVEHKPQVTEVRVFAGDYAILHKWPELARHYGFEFIQGRIMFKGLVLKPDVTNGQ
jgi:hypothetical protein